MIITVSSENCVKHVGNNAARANWKFCQC